MSSPESSACGGMFREEIAQQLLTSCAAIVKSCFGDLYDQCERKQEGCDVFRSCIDMVRTGWVEDDFNEEMRLVPNDFDTQVRGSFIVFVRQTYTDTTGANTVHVRVTVPPTIAFLRELLRTISTDEDLRNGLYFRSQSRLEQKDVVMQAIRGAMKALCSEFVYVPDKEAAAEVPTVRARDSVSEDGCSEGEVDDQESDEREEGTSAAEPESDISVNIRNAPDVAPKHHHGHERHGDDERPASEVSARSKDSARTHRSKVSKTSSASTHSRSAAGSRLSKASIPTNHS